MNKLLFVIMGLAWMLTSFCFANKYEDMKDSVVRIEITLDDGRVASGSGFIIDKDNGHIVTAGHVIRDANSINITFDDKRVVKTKVWKHYPNHDLGFLVVDPNSCLAEANKFGTVELGDEVIVIGSPFISEFMNSLSFGRITGLLRQSPMFDAKVNQTDAAINPGNSGGPVFNEDGEVVGICSLMYSPNGAFCGLGFILPSDYILMDYLDFEKDY